MQSCVDITTSSCMHYMHALQKYIRNNEGVREELRTCQCAQHMKPSKEQWQTYLNGYVEDIIEKTCCPMVRHSNLCYGTGSTIHIPKLIQWKCVKDDAFGDCGVEKMDFFTCPILATCEDTIDVIEWIYAIRQGKNKKEKQNTQLEVGNVRLAVKDVVVKLVESLNACHKHQSQYMWKNLMQTIDLTMGNPDNHHVICTGFGATLDLRGSEKGNSSVDNHAIICILFVVHGWRKVQFDRVIEGEATQHDETIVNDCDRWIFFGDTISTGKKKDHVFHNACVTYVIKHMMRKGKRITSYQSPSMLCGQTTVPLNTSAARTF